MVWLASYHKL